MSVFYRCNACRRTIGGTEKVYEIVICCKDRSGLGDWSAVGGTVVHLCSRCYDEWAEITEQNMNIPIFLEYPSKDLPKSSGFIAKAEEI